MPNTQVLIQETGRGYIGHALDYDAAGKGFMAVANADPNNANITPVRIYCAERGQPFNPVPIAIMMPNLKVDTGCVAITHTGTSLVVSVSTHAPGEAPRATMVETYVVPNVWATTPAFEAERGGPGGYTGGEQEPNPGGGGITLEELNAALDDKLGRFVGTAANDSLVHKIVGNSNQSLREALRNDLMKDAVLQLLTGSDAKANQYRAALYDFVKNANAGVQDNIIFGRDAWGAVRRAGLVAIVHEGAQGAREQIAANLQDALDKEAKEKEAGNE